MSVTLSFLKNPIAYVPDPLPPLLGSDLSLNPFNTSKTNATPVLTSQTSTAARVSASGNPILSPYVANPSQPSTGLQKSKEVKVDRSNPQPPPQITITAPDVAPTTILGTIPVPVVNFHVYTAPIPSGSLNRQVHAMPNSTMVATTTNITTTTTTSTTITLPYLSLSPLCPSYSNLNYVQELAARANILLSLKPPPSVHYAFELAYQSMTLPKPQ